MTQNFNRLQILKFVVSIFATITLCACGPDFDEPQNTDLFVKDGWKNYRSESYDSAIKNFNDALAIDPQLATAHAGIGWSEFQKQNVSDAISAFQKAIEIDPEIVDAHVGLSGAFLADRDYRKAITHAEKALKLAPDYVFEYDDQITSTNLHLVIAMSAYYLEDYDQSLSAVHAIDESIKVDQENIEKELLKILEKLAQQIGV